MSSQFDKLDKKECWRFDCKELTNKDYFANLKEFDYSDSFYYLAVDVSLIRSMHSNTRVFRYFVFDFECQEYSGWITNSIDKNDEKETYPAYDTWDGWVEIHNNYDFLPKYRKDLEEHEKLFFFPAFVSKKKMVEYIEKEFFKAVLESEFRW